MGTGSSAGCVPAGAAATVTPQGAEGSGVPGRIVAVDRTTCLSAASGSSSTTAPAAAPRRAGEALQAWAGRAEGRGRRGRGAERGERGGQWGGGTAAGDVSVSFWIGHVRLPGKQSRNRWEEGSGWSVQSGWRSSAFTLSSPLPSSQAASPAFSGALGAETVNAEE